MADMGYLGAPDGSLAEYIAYERRKAARAIAKRREDVKAMQETLAGDIAADDFLV